MPWVVSGLFATEPSIMLGDDLATLPDDDAIRIGMNLDGPTERSRRMIGTPAKLWNRSSPVSGL